MSRTCFRVNPHSIVACMSRNSLLWMLSDCNWTRTQNHLVRKRTLNTQLCSEYLSIWCIWRTVWPNAWVFVYELSGSESESSCSHLNFRFCACFEQVVPWHSGNYRVWNHSEMHTWHDKNILLKNLKSREYCYLKLGRLKELSSLKILVGKYAL